MATRAPSCRQTSGIPSAAKMGTLFNDGPVMSISIIRSGGGLGQDQFISSRVPARLVERRSFHQARSRLPGLGGEMWSNHTSFHPGYAGFLIRIGLTVYMPSCCRSNAFRSRTGLRSRRKTTALAEEAGIGSTVELVVAILAQAADPYAWQPPSPSTLPLDDKGHFQIPIRPREQ